MTVPGPSYPGNSALSPDVRQRVESTYRQSLELAVRGNRQEASLGCDFVLQLDPDYAPAQELLERLESGRPVAVPAAAEAGGAEAGGGRAAPSRHAEADELFGGGDRGVEMPDLFDLPELPDLPSLEAPAPPAAAPRVASAAPAAGGDLAGRLAALLAAGRAAEAVELAKAHPEALTAEPRAAELATTAASRLEAAPYVERFLAQADEARRQGDEAAARALLDKAAALDPSHPGLAAAAAAPTPEAAPGLDPEATVLAGSPAVLAAPTAPPPAATAAPAGEPDPFAALGGSGEERRIDDLLAEGQAAYDRGDHQAAIDAWSRIFLIDIDHAEAARRIEDARRLKAEEERAIEEVFHEAEAALGRGDREAARQGYERVLAVQPGHVEARQRLEGLDQGGDDLAAAIGAAANAAGVTGAAPSVAASEAAGPLREEILVPPEPGEAPPTAAAEGAGRRLVAVRESRAGRRFVLIGTVVLLLVVAAGYLLWSNRARIFPNAEDAAAPVVEEDAIARATRLHRAGRTAMAINQLRRLPPSAPEYAEAQALISQWEAETAVPPAAAELPEAPVDPAADERQALIDEARLAAGRDEYLVALARLEQAAALEPLAGEAAALQAEIERDLAPVARLVDLVRQGEHERALPDLWRRYEASPGDRVVRHLLVEAYYRMGTRDLQRGDAAAAAEHLAEAAELAPDDPLLARHQRFAESYAQREKDLLYRIYVKYLPPR